MPTTVVKRSVVISGHKTSVSLEQVFFRLLKRVARERGMPMANLIAEIDSNREQGNLSSAIRVFVLKYVAERAQMPLEED